MQKLILIASLAVSMNAYAGWDGLIVNPKTQNTTALEDIVMNLEPGSVVVLGEKHDNAQHHANQKTFLEALATAQPSRPISVGLEFIDFSSQPDLSSYVAGQMPEPEFLKAVGWGRIPFEFYKPLVLFPSQHWGTAYGINLPNNIASKIGKQGLDSLAPAEKLYLPPRFELGRDSYKKRFIEMIGSHPGFTPQMLDNYFAAQSAWDDTMAFNALRDFALTSGFFVIIVGNGHVEYGGGLPDRLYMRGQRKVLTFTQIDATELSESELHEALAVSPEYGEPSDYVWISGEPKP